MNFKFERNYVCLNALLLGYFYKEEEDISALCLYLVSNHVLAGKLELYAWDTESFAGIICFDEFQLFFCFKSHKALSCKSPVIQLNTRKVH